MPRLTKAEAKKRIQKLIDQIEVLASVKRGSPEFTRWHRDTRVALENIFSEIPERVEEFTAITFYLRTATTSTTEPVLQGAYIRGLRRAEAILQSMVGEIEEYWLDGSTETTSSTNGQPSQPTVTNETFLIHGRDSGTRETVARFLESLGIEAIILQEQPDEGQTIIQKFERYAEANFALALFTPDDVGGLENDAPKPRSRQNVIFEFGYFIGKYGRARVRALVKGDIEIPSDYSGVLYIQFDDSERWKMDLIRELKSAGFDIDANRAFD